MSPEVRELLRYKSALNWWYASMFAAARRGETFDKPQPEPKDFQPAPQRQWNL
jgi:hypothetical protein